MKINFILCALFGLIISTSPFQTFQMANAQNQVVVAIKQDNFNAPTAADVTRLDEIFMRSGTAFYQPNWKATYSGGSVLIVNNQESQVGGFFSKNRIFLNNTASAGFSTYFQISQNGGHSKYFPQPGFGDGFVFVVSRDFNVIGSIGGGIGYTGITRSLAVLFDTFDNGNQPPMCISLGIDGRQMPGCINVGGSVGTLNVWIDYSREAQTMEMRMNRSNAVRPANPTTRYTGLDFSNVGEEFFAGFTSSTGGAVQNTILHKWYMTGFFAAGGVDPANAASFVAPQDITITPVIEPVYLEDRKSWSFKPGTPIIDSPVELNENPVSFHTYNFTGTPTRLVYTEGDYPLLPSTNRIVFNLYVVTTGGTLTTPAQYPFHKAFYNLNYPNAPILQDDFIEYRLAFPITADQPLLVPTRPGYTFKGWATTSTQKSNLKTTHSFVRDTLFFAQWTINPLQVSFNTNGGSFIEPLITDVESGITLPESPTKDFADFVGWYTDEALTIAFNPNSTYGSDMTLFAKWAPVQYTVTVNCEITNPENMSIGHGDVLSLENKTNTTDQIFQGYFMDEALTQGYVRGPITSDTTIYTKWLDISPANAFTAAIAPFNLATLKTSDKNQLAALSAMFSALDAEQIPYISEANRQLLIDLNSHMNDLLIVEALVFDIDSLERIATLSMEEDILDALSVFEGLTPSQISLLPIDRQHHLLDLKAQFDRLMNAEEVAMMIRLLPVALQADDLVKLEETYSAYLTLTEMEKDLLDPALRSSLMIYASQQPNLQAVHQFIGVVDLLSFPLNIEQLSDVENMLVQWSMLTEAQKKLVPPQYQDVVYQASTTMIHLQIVAEFEELLNDVDGEVDEGNKAIYDAIIVRYQALHEDQVAMVSEATLSKINTILDRLRALNNTNPIDPGGPGEEIVIPPFIFPWIVVFVSLSILAGSYIVKVKK